MAIGDKVIYYHFDKAARRPEPVAGEVVEEVVYEGRPDNERPAGVLRKSHVKATLKLADGRVVKNASLSERKTHGTYQTAPQPVVAAPEPQPPTVAEAPVAEAAAPADAQNDQKPASAPQPKRGLFNKK